MTPNLQTARDNAVISFRAKDAISLKFYQQRHPRECVTACLRIISGRPESGLIAPPEGLSWSESLMAAATYGLYLQPVFDASILHGPLMLLGMMAPSASTDGHAYLVYSIGDNIKEVFDPATGQVYPIDKVRELTWTHVAVVYKP